MSNTIYIILRNDDPGALSNPVRERKILEMFAKYNAPQVFAVIPNNVEDPHVYHKGACHPLEENPAIISLLQEYQAKGLVEIAQHGYTHQTNQFRPSLNDEITKTSFYQGIDRVWTAYQPAHAEGYSEFNGLPLEQQKEKIVKGKQYLEKIFGRKLKSFIFPWNSFNPECVTALKGEGFQFVPGQDDEYVVPGMCIIGCCIWDWQIEEYRKLLKEMQAVKKPVLTQFAYHSWEIDEPMTQKIEGLLRELTAYGNVKFIMPQDIPKVIPLAPLIIRLRCWMANLEKNLNVYFDRKMCAAPYYVLDVGYYFKRVLKLSLSYLLLKIGLKKSLTIIAVAYVLFVSFLFYKYHSRQLMLWDAIPFLMLWALLKGRRIIQRRLRLE